MSEYTREHAEHDLFRIAMYGDRGNQALMRERIGKVLDAALSNSDGYKLPSSYVNAARISGSDMPHTVLQKLDAAARTAIQKATAGENE
jgi:hypothetical protein